jgi:hypothetical protein
VGLGSQTTGASVNTSHTIKGNCCVAIGMAWPNNTVNSATCGGVTMLFAGSASNNGSAGNGGLSVYYLQDPPTGTSLTVQFNYSATPSFVSFNSMSYFNVGSVGTFAQWHGSVGQTVGNTFTGSAIPGGMIVNGISAYGVASATQSGYTQTQRYAPPGQGTTVFTVFGDAHTPDGNAAPNFGETYSVTGTWNYSNIALPLGPIFSAA